MTHMPVRFSLIQRFEQESLKLDELCEKNDALFESVKKHLGIAKITGTSLIGNPFLRLENQIITLKYLILHHQMNFEVYKTEIICHANNDDSMTSQLESMYELSNRYLNQHLDLKRRLNDISRSKNLQEFAISA